MPVDTDLIKRNIQKMIDAGAPEADIDGYVQAATGVTPAPPGGGVPGRPSPSLFPLTRGQEVLEKVVRPVVETAGLVGGGLVGAATTKSPVATAVVAGAGYAGAKSFLRGIRRTIGYPSPQDSLTEEVIRTAEDVPTGTAMHMGGEVVGKGLAVFGKKVLAPFAKKMTPEAVERAALAKEYDIPMTAADITQSRAISMAEKALEMSPGSADIMQEHGLRQLKALTAKRDALVARYGPKEDIDRVGLQIQNLIQTHLKGREAAKAEALAGVTERAIAKGGLTPSEAGKQAVGVGIKETVTARSEVASDAVDEVFAHMRSLVSPTQKVSVPAFQARAQALLDEELALAPSLQDDGMIRLLRDFSGGGLDQATRQAVENLPGPIRQKIIAEQGGYQFRGLEGNLKRLNALIRAENMALRTGAPGAKFLSTEEGGMLQQLKNALKDDLTAFSNATGGEVKVAHDAAMAAYASQKQVFANPTIVKLLKLTKTSPERVVDAVVLPGGKGVTATMQLRQAAGEEGFQPVKDHLVGRWLALDPKSLGKTLAKYGDETLNSVFTAKEVAALKEAAAKGIRLENAEVGTELFRIVMRSDPDKAVGIIVRPDQPLRIQEAQHVLGEKGMERVRRAFLEILFPINAQRNYSPASAVTEANKYGEAVLKQLFNKPGEYQAVMNQLALARGARGAEKVAANPSGTGQAVVSYYTFGAVIRHPIKNGFGLVLIPRGLANLYLSDIGRKYLTTGLTVPTGSPELAAMVTKLLAIAGTDAVEERKLPQPGLSMLHRSTRHPAGVAP